MQYKVILNGATLKNMPIGINKLESSFRRDIDLKGVFIEELLEIRFVGDGYCILENIQNSLIECEFPVIIYQICDGEEKLIFNGIADTFSIRLDVFKKEAAIVIKDNSPINRLLRYRESLYYSTSDTALDGITSITPPVTHDIDFKNAQLDSPTSEWEDIPVYEAMELLQGLLDWITPNSLTVESIFFNQIYTTEKTVPPSVSDANNYRRVYEITYSTTPSSLATTIISYRNFFGIKFTETIVGAGAAGSHLRNVWTSLLKFQSISNLGDRIVFGRRYDYQLWDFGQDDNVDTIFLRSFLDNEIISIVCDEATVNFEFTSNPDFQYIDSGNNTCFLNGRMLRKSGNDNFIITFKSLIDELDKMYNILFLIQDGQFIIENYQSFQTNDIILTIDNVTELSVQGSLENIYSKISTGDEGGNNTQAFSKKDYLSTFCGVDKNYDSQTESTCSWVNIWDTIENPNEDNDDTMFIVQGNSDLDTSAMTFTEGTLLLSRQIATSDTSFCFILNGQIINGRRVIRHFPKFLGDLSVSPYKKVVNTDESVLLKDISFNCVISRSNYQLIINNNLDNIKIKSKDSDYYIGIVQEINYNYTTGEARFLIFGKKFE